MIMRMFFAIVLGTILGFASCSTSTTQETNDVETVDSLTVDSISVDSLVVDSL